ncbi:hypothetical protein ACHAWF_013766 [Thalassiosira exigua]
MRASKPTRLMILGRRERVVACVGCRAEYVPCVRRLSRSRSRHCFVPTGSRWIDSRIFVGDDSSSIGQVRRVEIERAATESGISQASDMVHCRAGRRMLCRLIRYQREASAHGIVRIGILFVVVVMKRRRFRPIQDGHWVVNSTISANREKKFVRKLIFGQIEIARTNDKPLNPTPLPTHLLVAHEQTNLHPTERPVHRQRRRDQLRQPMSSRTHEERTRLLVVIEAAQEHQQDDGHDDVHHRQSGEGHRGSAEVGDVFDVGGEEVQSAVGGVGVELELERRVGVELVRVRPPLPRRRRIGPVVFGGTQREHDERLDDPEEPPLPKAVQLDHPGGEVRGRPRGRPDRRGRGRGGGKGRRERGRRRLGGGGAVRSRRGRGRGGVGQGRHGAGGEEVPLCRWNGAEGEEGAEGSLSAAARRRDRGVCDLRQVGSRRPQGVTAIE